MATPLMRKALRSLYKQAVTPHPGLLLQRGLPEHDEAESEAKTKHVARVCEARPGEFYGNAYGRWRRATADKQRFRQVLLALEQRLFAGLTGGGILETGGAISHSYGAPYIPGTSVKGVVAASARERLRTQQNGHAICDELFGAPATAHPPAGLSGLITIHDAWWVPDSASAPLVAEVVTSHHLEYYGKDGSTPATDFDSPVPNAQVAAQGKFLFVIEGPAQWLDLAESMLKETLARRGLGARTRSGYGLFKNENSLPAARSAWVDGTIARLKKENNAREDEVLRGNSLAQAFRAIEDAHLKREAFEDIRARWMRKSWWEGVRLKRAAKAAKQIYDDYESTRRSALPDELPRE